jgi:hypothetical protein
MPAIESSARTDFRPDVACETQEPPNLNAGAPADPPTQMTTQSASPQLTPELSSSLEGLQAPLDRAVELLDLNGKKARRGAELYDSTMEQLGGLLLQASGQGYLADLAGDAR